MIYQIFGKRLKFSFDDSLVSAILKEELLLYSGGEGADFDVEIEIGSKTEVPVRLSNPKGHLDFANGFAMQASSHILFFHFSDQRPSKVRVHINQPRNAFVSRLLSSQFTSTPETAGQIVHELVLVPIMFFFPDRFPIHASGFQTPSGKAALVGGTGGAGKTSLEIQFARLPGFNF